jgi:hypothetical protein
MECGSKDANKSRVAERLQEMRMGHNRGGDNRRARLRRQRREMERQIRGDKAAAPSEKSTSTGSAKNATEGKK